MEGTTRRDFMQRAAAGAALLTLGPLAEAGAAPLPGKQLRALRNAVRGQVLAPGNGGYDAARMMFNTRYDGIRPPAVVKVANSADVQAVVKWAATYDVPLVARRRQRLQRQLDQQDRRRGRRRRPRRPSPWTAIAS